MKNSIALILLISSCAGIDAAAPWPQPKNPMNLRVSIPGDDSDNSSYSPLVPMATLDDIPTDNSSERTVCTTPPVPKDAYFCEDVPTEATTSWPTAILTKPSRLPTSPTEPRTRPTLPVRPFMLTRSAALPAKPTALVISRKQQPRRAPLRVQGAATQPVDTHSSSKEKSSFICALVASSFMGLPS